MITRNKRALFALLASMIASVFILFGCGTQANNASADVPARFKLLYAQDMSQSANNVLNDTVFMIYEDTQTHVEYIVADVYGRGVSMTPLLGLDGKVEFGP